MGRPLKYDRKKQSTIRFYVDKEKKLEIQIMALKQDTTLQELYDEATEEIYEKLKKGEK